MKTAMRIEKKLTYTEWKNINGKIRKECIIDEKNHEDGTEHKTLRIYISTDTNELTYTVGKLNELGIYDCEFQRVTI